MITKKMLKNLTYDKMVKELHKEFKRLDEGYEVEATVKIKSELRWVDGFQCQRIDDVPDYGLGCSYLEDNDQLNKAEELFNKSIKKLCICSDWAATKFKVDKDDFWNEVMCG